ncbi:MAG: hypothetical protein Q9166_007270 [cf. Caloplaca sp. 2 TL-2023]
MTEPLVEPGLVAVDDNGEAVSTPKRVSVNVPVLQATHGFESNAPFNGAPVAMLAEPHVETGFAASPCVGGPGSTPESHSAPLSAEIGEERAELVKDIQMKEEIKIEVSEALEEMRTMRSEVLEVRDGTAAAQPRLIHDHGFGSLLLRGFRMLQRSPEY